MNVLAFFFWFLISIFVLGVTTELLEVCPSANVTVKNRIIAWATILLSDVFALMTIGYVTNPSVAVVFLVPVIFVLAWAGWPKAGE